MNYIKYIKKQYGGDVSTEPKATGPTEQPIELPEKESVKIDESKLTESIYEFKKENCSGTAGLKYAYITEASGAPKIDYLFGDENIKIEITEKPVFIPPTDIMQNYRNALNKMDPIKEEDKKLIVNEAVSIRELIKTKEDEIDQGERIINWIKKEFNRPENKLVHGLKLFIHNGYVHIIREGLGRVAKIPPKIGIISGQDVITHQLVGDLKHLKWQYDIPIDYDTLRKILFSNKFQKSFKSDMEIQQEAEKILSQEFLIAIQPEPVYLMWALKRLIICWFADRDLQDNIRKIKVLINLYRARSDVDYNKQYGVLPIIVVYPRYGSKSAEIVLKKLSYYFFLRYLTTGWKCSNPTYFIKINELLHYTNAAIDLKEYYRKVLEASNDSLTNDSFTEKYTYMQKGDYLIER